MRRNGKGGKSPRGKWEKREEKRGRMREKCEGEMGKSVRGIVRWKRREMC